MSQKFLMAIDNSNTAIRMAEYLKNILKKDDKVIIYNVISNPLLLFNPNPEALPIYTDNKEVFSNIENAKKEEIHKIIQNIINIISQFINKDNIKYELDGQREDTSIAKHIAEEAERGNYNAIVIGKHNSSSMITEFLLGSVTHKVIHLSKNIPVIVI